jgi:WD40 repeat protein/serine/threonine protein kinase
MPNWFHDLFGSRNEGVIRGNSLAGVDERTTRSFEELKLLMHRKLVEKIDVSRALPLQGKTLQREVRLVVECLCDTENPLLNRMERERLIDEVLDEAFGFGPLEGLLRNPTISTIHIHGPRDVRFQKSGDWRMADVRFRDDAHLESVLDRLKTHTASSGGVLNYPNGRWTAETFPGPRIPGFPAVVLSQNSAKQDAEAASSPLPQASAKGALSQDIPSAPGASPSQTVLLSWLRPVPSVPRPGAGCVRRALSPLRGADEEVPEVWAVGQVILGLYEVLRIHETGGMGLVYRVRHRGWNLDLAVKSPRPEFLADDRDKDDFEREAETWVKLGLHPHTVSCYYVRRLGGIPRLFAEYVEGGSLSEWIRDGRLYEGGPDRALARILDVAIQFAWGLQYAHEQGLVHQDVKPANLLLTPDGTAKVTDFGLARARAVGARGCPAGGVGTVLVSGAGLTPAYCSPEQESGARLSRKTDLWSWGLSVLEMFTGKTTWSQGTLAPQVLEAYLQQRPAHGIPAMPGPLADMLRQCFEHEPAARPADMAEVVTVLCDVYRQAIGADFPRPAPRPAEARADSLNNRAVSLLDLGKQSEAEVLLQEALRLDPQHLESNYHLGLLQWWSGRLTDEALLYRLGALAQAHPGHWLGPYLVAQVCLSRGEPRAALRSLEQISSADAERAEIRAAKTLARQRATEAAATEIVTGHSGAVTALGFSSDRGVFLTGSQLEDPLLSQWATLRMWDAEANRCLRTFDMGKGSVVALRLSSDGQTVAVLGRFQDVTASARSALGDFPCWKLEVLDVTTGSRRRTFSPGDDRVTALGLSDDGRFALTGGSSGWLTLWDVSGGQPPRRWQGHEGAVAGVALHAGDSRAVSAGADGVLKVWDSQTGQCLATLNGDAGPLTALNAGPALWYLVTGAGNGNLLFWDLQTRQRLATARGHAGPVTAVCLSQDGLHALSGGADGTLRYWDATTGRCLRTLEAGAAVTALCFGPGGQWALSAQKSSRTVRRWGLTWDDSAPFLLCRIVPLDQTQTAQKAHEEGLARARQSLRQGQTAQAAAHLRSARSQPGYERSPAAFGEWTSLYLALPRKTLRGAWEARTLTGHDGRVNSVSLAADGCLALSAGEDRRLRLWETATGRCVRIFEHDPGEDEAWRFSRDWPRKLWAVLSRDGRHALSGVGSSTRTLWEVATGQRVRTFEWDFTAALLTPDGRYTLSAVRPNLTFAPILCENATGRRLPLGNLDDPLAWVLTASCLGRGAVAGTLGLFDLHREPSRAFHESIAPVVSPCLSSNGRFLLSGRGAQLAWSDLAAGRCLGFREGHRGPLHALALTADGRFGLSGGADAALKVWRFGADQTRSVLSKVWSEGAIDCLGTFEGHSGEITGLAVSADSRLAVTASADRTVKVWSLDWELDDPPAAEWDPRAEPHLRTFLLRQTPWDGPPPKGDSPSPEEVARAFRRRGAPVWDAPAFQGLLYDLGCAGFGWLRPDHVRGHLEQMAVQMQREGKR